MSEATERLLQLLTLERLDEAGAQDRYLWRGATGKHAANLSGRLFGGVVIAQAIMAAGRSDTARRVHSAQLNFLRGGSVDVPADYGCTKLFEGRTYATWRVDVTQTEPGSGSQQLIAHATVGLTAGVDDAPDWHEPAAETPDFVTAVDRDELVGRRDPATQPVQTRVDATEHGDTGPTLTLWAKPNGTLPEDPLVHQALLGYVSDRGMVTVARKAHAQQHQGLNGATLDHAIWFHRPVVFDRWHSHSMRNSSLVDGRGMTHGTLHRQDSTGQSVLVATTAQQSALRVRST